jgi:hypothetical protein
MAWQTSTQRQPAITDPNDPDENEAFARNPGIGR